MKTKEIKIGNKTILVVDLPKEKQLELFKIAVQVEGAKANALTEYEFQGNPHFRNNERLRWAMETLNKKFRDLCSDIGIDLPDGVWQLLGFVSEDVAVKVVPKSGGRHIGCKDLELPSDVKEFGKLVHYFTALEALLSHFKSNGITTVNPYEKPEHTDFYTGDGCFDTDEYYKILARYDTTQSQLWVNPVILEKV